MLNIFLCLSFIISFFLNNDSESRPISYASSWTVMQKNDFNKNSIHIHYSPSTKYSVGLKSEFWREKEWQFHGAQFNYLIKRFNTPKSQYNFYLKNAFGVAFSDYQVLERNVEPNLFSGISFDWEDRKYYFSYENRINYNLSIDKFFMQKSRIGIAPYIGDYGDLHTWIMLQLDNMSSSKNKIVYTPMIRIFKGDFLAEAGLNNDLDVMFNFIKRF